MVNLREENVITGNHSEINGLHARKTDEKAETLSGLIDYTGKEVSACTSGIFENKQGGRICVAGLILNE